VTRDYPLPEMRDILILQEEETGPNEIRGTKRGFNYPQRGEPPPKRCVAQI